MQQQGGAPRCRLVVSDDTIVADVTGGTGDSVEDCVHAAHNELRWLMERDDVAFIDHTEVINIDPTASD